ncbi:DUF488 domain-containing protein [Belnapia moabensis]|uniref:DUF488 domain-containing protein n=1 Tax=Belnapia moabensis TaxID=365533 RepID=UPI0005B82B7B|nr:DUF488 domain-containing protein [Belnapia moabensis]
MSVKPKSLLTIGHSNHPLEMFLALLRQHGVTAVADVRSAPFSRFNPQYNKVELERGLKAEGIRYVFLGRELGARSDDPACYEGGRVRYARLACTEAFRQGIERLCRGALEHRIVCLCAEKEPLECHRTLLVARALEAEGVEVTHIHADGGLEPNTMAMERLLDVTGLPREDLFRSREELVAEALARQEEKVAYVDEKLANDAENT